MLEGEGERGFEESGLVVGKGGVGRDGGEGEEEEGGRY